MKRLVWLLLAAAVLLAGCPAPQPPMETTAPQSPVDAPPVTSGTELRFSSFDGGGHEYTLTAEDPSILSFTARRDYGSAEHDTQTGASYEMVFTLTGLQPGTTGITVYGASPILDSELWLYTAVVDENLSVSLSPVQTICQLTLYRDGFLALENPRYQITPGPEGFTLTVDEAGSCDLSLETVDALYDVFQRYDMARWDGFAESNPYVLDGEGFLVEVLLTDGTRVQASGENAFPPHYHEAMDAMTAILKDAAKPIAKRFD